MTPPDHVARSLLVHASFVRRLANGLTGGDGDDLAQDAWSAALQHDVRDVRDATGWLATIVKNLWRNRRRGELRRVARERSIGATETVPSVASILEIEEARRRVVAAVVALPERLRAVVLCRYYEDLDSTAIGERLGVPASTVRSRLREAHGQLRASLDAEHGDRRAWLAPLVAWCAPQRAPLTLLRAAASIRIAVGGIAVLLLGWWVTMVTQPAPASWSQKPIGTVQVASRDEPSGSVAAPRAQREAVAVAAAPGIGPEDLPGRVIDAATGAPVAGAEVVLEHRDSDEFAGFDLDGVPSIDIIGTARSDIDGRFAFRVQRALQHRLTVTAAGFAKETLSLCTGGSAVLVRVAAPASISGVVRRKCDRAPLADAEVAAAEYGGAGQRVTTRTGADGTFVLTDLAPRATYVSIRAKGMKPTGQQVELLPAAHRNVESVMESGGTVHGVVCDGVTKLPIAGVRVAVDRRMRTAAVTAHDGAFELPDVGDSDRLQVQADGYAPRVVFRASGDHDTTFEVSMFAGVAVIGRVVDTEGHAVPEARVVVSTHVMHFDHERAFLSSSATVGGDGAFRIDGVPIDGLRPEALDPVVRWELSARAKDRGARTIALPAERLREGLFDVGNVVLERSSIVEGRIVEKDGTPVGDVEVLLDGTPRGFEALVPERTLLPPPLWFARTTRTAPDGAFRIGGLAAGRYSIRARAGNEDLDVPDTSREVDDGEIAQLGDLRVDRGECISGVVRIAGGRAAAADDRIYLMARNEQTMNRGARVLPDGSFRIERLAPGRYTLHSIDTPEGFTLVPRVDVAAGTSNIELLLVPAAVFEGVIVDADGHPVPRAKVVFFPDAFGAGHSTPADEQGRFRIEAPPGVRGRLNAQHPDNQWYQVSLPDMVAPQSGLELKLRRGFF